MRSFQKAAAIVLSTTLVGQALAASVAVVSFTPGQAATQARAGLDFESFAVAELGFQAGASGAYDLTRDATLDSGFVWSEDNANAGVNALDEWAPGGDTEDNAYDKDRDFASNGATDAVDLKTVVPAPAALGLGALGLAGAFALRRKLS